MNAARLCALLMLLTVFFGCATPTDPWREAARKPLDTGSHAWWDQVKGNNK